MNIYSDTQPMYGFHMANIAGRLGGQPDACWAPV